jgi:tetratricopeptide (TPR) repeat protein
MAAKVTKKEIEKPDPFYEWMERVYGYLATHKKKFYIGAGVLAAICLISTVYYFYSQHLEQQAEKLYLKAYDLQYSRTAPRGSDMASLAPVFAAYEEVTKTYPGSLAAANAYYMLGNLYYRAGDYDKARSSFESFLDKAPRKHALMPFAYTGLGYCYEEKKEYPKALEAFEKAVGKDTGGVLTGVTYGNMARIYEEMNNAPKALELYKQALENTSDPAMAAFIKRKIAQLGS